MVVEQGQGENHQQLENAHPPPPPVSRKPRNREVSSRYKTAIPAPATSRRFPSPNFGRAGDVAPPEPPKRALSAERKREGEDSTTRASVSNSRIDHALKPAANGLSSARPRGSTPERKRPPGSRQTMDQVENARPLENVSKPAEIHKWPGTANGKSISRSLDLNLEREKTRGSSIGAKVSRSLVPPARSVNQVDEGNNKIARNSNKVDETKYIRSSFQGDEVKNSLNRVDGVKSSRSTVKQIHETSRSVDEVSKHARSLSQDSELKSTINETTNRVRRRLVEEEACDTDSTASGGPEGDYTSGKLTEGTTDSHALPSARANRPLRGTVVPARFWQDLGNRIRRLSDVNQLRASLPDADLLAAGSKTARRPKGVSAPSSAANSPGNAAPWTYSSSRVTSSTQPSSPSRGVRSPTRTRSGAFPVPPNGLNSQVSRSSSVACMLNFGAEVSRARKAMTQQEEAQYLRILYNRLLQWRYVNARTEHATSSQQAAVERMLYSAWLQISDLQTRVAEKRIKLQTTRQDVKVHSFIALHRDCLEDWERIEPEQKLAVAGAIQALEAATLKVPVTGGAKIDIQALKNAMTVAADAIAPLDSATKDLLPQAEATNEILSQLAQVSSQGKALLEECGDLLDRIATLETEEWSLRAYFIQLENDKKRRDC